MLPLILLEANPFPTINLQELDLTPHTFKENNEGGRCTFIENHQFFKVFSQDNSQRERFFKAYLSGYFDNITFINSIIVDTDNACIGYSMPTFPTVNITKAEDAYYEMNFYNCYSNWGIKSENFDEFVERMILATQKYGYVFIDFSPTNLLLKDGKYYITDLESILTLEEMYELFSKRIGLYDYFASQMPLAYQSALKSLMKVESVIQEKIMKNPTKNFIVLTATALVANIFGIEKWEDPSIDMSLLREAWQWPGGGSEGKPYYRLNVNGEYFNGERDWVQRWHFMKNATDYSGKRILELGCNIGIASAFMLKYANAASAVGIELPDERLRIHGNPMVPTASKLFLEAMGVDNFTMRQMDFDVAPYEELLGTDYDIVVCMSFLRWMKDEERLLRYLSNFKEVIFEGHESDEVEISKFRRHGFSKYEILGSSVVGRSSPSHYKRTVIRFSK